MFRNALLTSVVLLLLMCVSSMVVLAQDGPTDASVSESQSNMIIFTATDLLEDTPETIQELRDLGVPNADIARLQIHVSTQTSASPSRGVVGTSSVDGISCPCGVGQQANMLLQTGAGNVYVKHTYTNGYTEPVGTHYCPNDALFCVFYASAQESGHAPWRFIARSSYYNHAISTWCSG